jgi:Mrp family chromosome partitioning ATPase
MDHEKLLVMDDTRQVWLFAQRNARLIITIAIAMTLVALLLAWVLPVRYQGSSIVMLNAHKMKLTGLEDAGPSIPPDSSTVRSEIDVIKSRSVIDRVIKDLGLAEDRDFVPGPSWTDRFFASEKDKEELENRARRICAEKLQKNLDVANDGRSFTIGINYFDHNAARAAQIANAFADEYLVDQLEVKFDLMQRANAWLAERIENLRTQVSNAEKAVADYKAAHNLEQVKDQTVAQQQLSAVSIQITQASAELSQTQARMKAIKGGTSNGMEASSAVLASPLIQQLKQQEAEVRRKEADLAMRYGDRHPALIDARNELSSIRGKIGEEIHKFDLGLQNDVLVAQAKLDSLNDQLKKLRAENGVGNQAMVTLRQLEREAAASRTLYEGFLNRSKSITEQQEMHMADARIIAHAEIPLKPVFPNPMMFWILGLVLGLVLGFMVALLLEYMDRGFRTLDMIEKVHGVSGLGGTPALNLPARQSIANYVLEKPLSAYSEAIRGIYTSIVFSNVDAKPKVIMITSSLPDEGKTSFAISFARVLAKSGSKVLLIEADMRRPRIQAVLGANKNKIPDLAAVLAQTATFEDALQKDPSGAHVIVSASKTPNPHDLLSSHQMGHLVEKARAKYDVIIIDTPPIMAVADAAAVGKLVDTTVYVVRWAETPRETVGEGLKLAKNYNIRLAGIVMTQIDMREQKSFGYSGYYDDKYKGYYSN